MKRRLAIIAALLLLLTSLYRAVPESVATPIAQAVSRAPVEVVLSSAPAAGTVVELSLPAELLSGNVPVIEKPGIERRIKR